MLDPRRRSYKQRLLTSPVVVATALAFNPLPATAAASGAEPGDPAGAKGERGALTSVTAVAGGLDLVLFGSPVSVGLTTAAIDNKTATARATGVDANKETATSARVDTPATRRFSVLCSPTTVVFKFMRVESACGESRTQRLPPIFGPGYPRHIGAAMLDPQEMETNPPPAAEGGPQAVGRASAQRVDVTDATMLEPSLRSLENLLTSVRPLSGMTVEAAAAAIDPASRAQLLPVATGLGLRPTDIVEPAVALVEQLLEGGRRATALVSVIPPASTATANTSGQKLIAYARTEKGQVDLLLGFGTGGGPLLSISVAPADSTMTLDRATGSRSSRLTPSFATIKLGLPVAGRDVTELTVGPGPPITLFGGTAFETTVSVGDGRKIEDSAGGPLSSVADGVSVHLLKGVSQADAAATGIELRLAHVESAMGGDIDEAGGSKLGPALVVGAGLALAVSVALLLYAVRRRRPAAS